MAFQLQRLVAGAVGHVDENDHAQQDEHREKRARRRTAASPIEPNASPAVVMTSM